MTDNLPPHRAFNKLVLFAVEKAISQIEKRRQIDALHTLEALQRDLIRQEQAAVRLETEALK